MKIIKGTCVDYTHDGRGIIKHEGLPIFVDGLFIGEEADVEITYERKDYAVAKIKKLYKLSKDRIEPRCKVATACGGCSFQALAYPAQLAFKKRKVSEALRKLGGIDIEVDDVIGMDDPYFYRNKTQMPLGYDQQKRLISGFYRRSSHDIVPIDTCYIEDERAAGIMKKIKQAMKDNRIEAYDEDKRTGVIRHVLIKTSHAFNEIMAVLVTNADSFPGRGNLTKSIKEACPEITTLVQNINTRDTNVILGQKENILYGKGFIQDKLHGLTFNISSKSFYQVNPVQAEVLYDKAIEYANLAGNEIVLDAYCGVGTISLIASKKAKQVLGVEIVKEAIDDAIKNAKINKIENVRFYAQDVTEFISEIIASKQAIDVVIVDPPRKGLDESFINSIIKLKPKTFVYVSCEPSTLARDLKLLSKAYEVKKVTPVDMFPQTYHVETIVLLFLK
ncbi:MAG TPA: 23S rRNA (uracil(1939)-C(5))-methyltransferase RlmD [Bacilli bacterium]|nr:23S rRNA (uracil(1939)-C(5))-methyltransferase RlmD [Bacilli bacterium]